MSTLRETIEQRRNSDAPVPECATLDQPVTGLVVDVREGDSWTLPWSHVAAARVTGNPDAEKLELMFASFRVTAIGQNLRSLLPAIASFRLSHLQNLPSVYSGRCAAGAPFVHDLAVDPAPSLPETHAAKERR